MCREGGRRFRPAATKRQFNRFYARYRLGDIENSLYRCLRDFQSILRLPVLRMGVATLAESKVSLQADHLDDIRGHLA
jgi:hypothetical protein